MSAAPAAGLFSAGQRVRVSDGAASSRRALLLCLHAEGCDVEFEGTDEEESNVPLSRVAPLLDFEVGCARGGTGSPADAEDAHLALARAEQHKQQGNQLFKLRDHAAAAEEYAADPNPKPNPEPNPNPDLTLALALQPGMPRACGRCGWRRG